nr:TRAP transporter substrate-binding protein [uncultured Oscillibacter sp.]
MAGCGGNGSSSEDGQSVGDDTVYTAIFGCDHAADNPRVKAIEWMRDKLAERTNQRIQIDVQHSAVLGNATEMFGMLSTNALQMFIGNGYEQLSARFNIWNLPLTFKSCEEINAFSQSDLAKDIMGELNDPNIYIPAITYTPARNIVCTKNVTVPTDLKNMKMRSPNQNPIIDFYKTAGAIPVEMPPTDVYMATKQGTIDGSCNNSSNLVDYALYEVNDCFVYCDYMFGPDPLMVNRAWYESLPEDLQKIFDETAVEAFERLGQTQAEESSKYAQIMIDNSKSTTNVVEDPELMETWLEFGQQVQDAMIADGTVLQSDVDAVNEWLEEYRAQ